MSLLYDERVLEALTVLSFIVDMVNLNENLTQNDKDDILRVLDSQTKDILKRVEEALDEQNKMLEEQSVMLREILDKIENL